MARTGFHLAGDLIWVHGQRDGTSAQHRPRGHVSGPYTSLPAAIFMLAYAAEWVLPQQSGTGAMSMRLWRHAAFPLDV